MNEIPDKLNENLLMCPINHSIYKDPVILVGDGFTYEREAITRWLNIKVTSPVTNKRLKSCKLVQNKAIRSILHSLKHELSSADLEELILLDDLNPHEVALFAVVFINSLVIVNSLFLYTLVNLYVVLSLIIAISYSQAVYVIKQGNESISVGRWSYNKNMVLNSGLFLLNVILFSHVLANKRTNHVVVGLDMCFIIYYLISRR
jgi:hypothetical protein